MGRKKGRPFKSFKYKNDFGEPIGIHEYWRIESIKRKINKIDGRNIISIMKYLTNKQKEVNDIMEDKKKTNPWLVHLMKIKSENEGMKFSEVMKLAKQSYKKKEKEE